MILAIATIIVAFIVLIWSADRFVSGASGLASNLGVSPLIIGLTIVGFGTSAPEMLVSSLAAWQGNPGLAVGNALGSNIANIALVLGCTAIVSPIVVASGILRKELPILFASMILILVLMLDRTLNSLDGIIMIITLFIIMGWMGYQAANSPDDVLEHEFEDEIPQDMSTKSALFWLAIGMILLLASSRALVWAAVDIATQLGVSDLVIGLTIVAIGTSLPELAASIASALKNEHDIAVGNIVGSNLFNSLGVLGIPGLITLTPISDDVLYRDVPIMFGLTIALLLMAMGWGKMKRQINRTEGAILLTSFVGYQYLLFQQSV